ncbi:MAG: S46 family peptidase [Gemmataceae bacterium]
MIRRIIFVLLLLLMPSLKGARMIADEGMWLLNEPPRNILRDRYQFDLSEDWLAKAMKGSIRFTNGGSGAFVSPSGLIVTNHHIGSDSIQKLSTSRKNYLRDGFLARTPDQELKCPDLELNVLQEIVDVTSRIQATVKPGMSDAQAASARRAVISRIEKESTEKTGLRSDVVTLYQGGAYHLYRSKKYTDVRLVFAPEANIANFGGDTDNFEYPRHGFDVCFFRAYEGGKPVHPDHYFRWNSEGVKQGDLVFVTGHPGTTNRQDTVAMLKHRRDHTLPYFLSRLRYLEALLLQFGGNGPEETRVAAKDLHRVANARKAFAGQYQGLLNPVILAAKEKKEGALRRQIQSDDKLRERFGDTWKRIASTQKALSSFETHYYLLERGDAFDSDLFPLARHLLRLAVEKPKPSAERLREYGDARLASLEFQLFSPAPLSPELQRARLMGGFSFLAEQLGGEHPLVSRILAGKSPAERAAELISGTRLFDVAERKRLAEGGKKAVDASQDPLLALARLVEDDARAVRKRYEEEVEEPLRQAMSQIADARFSLEGKSTAPDATFTLRLAFGTVKGYEDEGGTNPFATTFASAFQRAEKMQHREPFVLPSRWLEGREKLNLATPFNFASTSDTIGGNSGSPVLNREGDLVGVNFDRNRHGLSRNFVYTDQQARHISVDCRAVLEALDKLYQAKALIQELRGR